MPRSAETLLKTQASRPNSYRRRRPQSQGSNGHLNELLYVLQAMRVGDFSVRMAGDQVGIKGKIADSFNEIVAANQRMAQQLERVGQVVGRDGKFGEYLNRRPVVAHDPGHPHHRGGCPRRLTANNAP